MPDRSSLSRRRFLRHCALGMGACALPGCTMAGDTAKPSGTHSMRFPVSDHCDGTRFFNPGADTGRHWGHVLKWRATSRAKTWPRDLPPIPAFPLPTQNQGDAISVTWINHSSFLLQTRAGAILCDPVYSERASPVGWAGPKRIHPPGVPFDKLPPIRAVLLSHDHYDHCDLPTLRRIAKMHSPLGITPLGNGELLREAGFTRIVELDWWGTHKLQADCVITATPALHWSNRVTGLRNRRLWSGFHLRIGPRSLYFAGDTGYDERLFKTFPDRLGPTDCALIPIGAYEPRWFMAPMHCDPLEAIKIHNDVKAKTSIAMHWGLWQLADEGRDDPPMELKLGLTKSNLSAEAFRILQPGESHFVA